MDFNKDYPGVIDVKMREVETADATYRFTRYPIDQLDKLIETVKQWGVYTSDGDETNSVTGQFVTKPGCIPYFELIVGGDE